MSEAAIEVCGIDDELVVAGAGAAGDGVAPMLQALIRRVRLRAPAARSVRFMANTFGECL
jgi:hypothetical protein